MVVRYNVPLVTADVTDGVKVHLLFLNGLQVPGICGRSMVWWGRALTSVAVVSLVVLLGGWVLGGCVLGGT